MRTAFAIVWSRMMILQAAGAKQIQEMQDTGADPVYADSITNRVSGIESGMTDPICIDKTGRDWSYKVEMQPSFSRRLVISEAKAAGCRKSEL